MEENTQKEKKCDCVVTVVQHKDRERGILCKEVRMQLCTQSFERDAQTLLCGMNDSSGLLTMRLGV